MWDRATGTHPPLADPRSLWRIDRIHGPQRAFRHIVDCEANLRSEEKHGYYKLDHAASPRRTQT